jgi:chromosome segregation ATPase
MEATQTANPPSFESVWALLEENAQGMKELRESQKETDRMIKATDRQMKKTERQMQRTDSELGKLSKRMGEVVEFMVAPNLREKFKELGFNFSKSNQKTEVTDEDNNISFEIDVFLENYSKAMLVEVKTTPTTENVKEHIKRLEKMRKYADLHGDSGLKSGRTFLGAVAGVVITDNVKKYVLKQGFFVIEPSGEGFNITPPNNKPKEW